VPCSRCLHTYKVFDIAANRVPMSVFEQLKRDKLAREMCDWIEFIERHHAKVYDMGENCYFFCHKCYPIIVRDIDLYEVQHLLNPLYSNKSS
jgi:hypothetical protein